MNLCTWHSADGPVCCIRAPVSTECIEQLCLCTPADDLVCWPGLRRHNISSVCFWSSTVLFTLCFVQLAVSVPLIAFSFMYLFSTYFLLNIKFGMHEGICPWQRTIFRKKTEVVTSHSAEMARIFKFFFSPVTHHCKALNSLICAAVPLRNHSLILLCWFSSVRHITLYALMFKSLIRND